MIVIFININAKKTIMLYITICVINILMKQFQLINQFFIKFYLKQIFINNIKTILKFLRLF